MDLVAPGHVGSSWTRVQNGVPHIAGDIFFFFHFYFIYLFFFLVVFVIH